MTILVLDVYERSKQISHGGEIGIRLLIAFYLCQIQYRYLVQCVFSVPSTAPDTAYF
jgi:hypothetical protein